MQEVYVKGMVFERDAVVLSHCNLDVNCDMSRDASPSATPCQDHVDTKAFTGRGTRPELRQLQVDVDRLSQRMRELVAASKSVSGMQIYLMLHQRHATGYMFLRWREMGGAKRHLSWEQAEAVYERYTPQLSAWYAGLAEQAREVNDVHLRLRRRVKSISEHLAKQEKAVYAKPIPA